MRISHTAFECAAFPYSNDRWDRETASELRQRLAAQITPPEDRAGLVIGAGTLPYTLDCLPATLFVADKSPSVAVGVAERCNGITKFDSWHDYQRRLADASSEALSEFDIAIESGLAGGIDHVQRAAKKSQIIPVVGDIGVTCADIAVQTETIGKLFTFINFTNVARYLGQPTTLRFPPNGLGGGRKVLLKVLDVLPVSEEVVICDSLMGLRQRLYSLYEYRSIS